MHKWGTNIYKPSDAMRTAVFSANGWRQQALAIDRRDVLCRNNRPTHRLKASKRCVRWLRALFPRLVLLLVSCVVFAAITHNQDTESIVPKDLKQLRACMVCSLVKTWNQFYGTLLTTCLLIVWMLLCVFHWRAAAPVCTRAFSHAANTTQRRAARTVARCIWAMIVIALAK